MWLIDQACPPSEITRSGRLAKLLARTCEITRRANSTLRCRIIVIFLSSDWTLGTFAGFAALQKYEISLAL